MPSDGGNDEENPESRNDEKENPQALKGLLGLRIDLRLSPLGHFAVVLGHLARVLSPIELLSLVHEMGDGFLNRFRRHRFVAGRL